MTIYRVTPLELHAMYNAAYAEATPCRKCEYDDTTDSVCETCNGKGVYGRVTIDVATLFGLIGDAIQINYLAHAAQDKQHNPQHTQ